MRPLPAPPVRAHRQKNTDQERGQLTQLRSGVRIGLLCRHTWASLLQVSKLVTWSPTAVICPTATLGALLC